MLPQHQACMVHKSPAVSLNKPNQELKGDSLDATRPVGRRTTDVKIKQNNAGLNAFCEVGRPQVPILRVASCSLLGVTRLLCDYARVA